MKSTRQILFIAILSLCTFTIACEDSSVGPEDQPDQVTFQGKVVNMSSSQANADKTQAAVEGAVVTAAHVNASGELQTIEGASVETNAEGRYSLTVESSTINGSSQPIVMVATQASQKAKTYVMIGEQAGSTVQVQPITFESSAEAEVFQRLVANGNADIVSRSTVEIMVGTQVAADIEQSAQLAEEAAAAIVASTQAEAEFYASEGIEISGETMNEIHRIKQEAMLQLAAELDAAANAEARQAAFEEFLSTVAHAETEAGVEAWAVAKANDLSARVLVDGSAELSSDAQAEVRKYAYYYTAVALDQAVQAQLKALGAAESTVSAAAAAGQELTVSIWTETQATQEAIDELFTRYNEEVQAAINSDTSLKGSAYVNINTAISGSSGLKATFENVLSATTDLSTALTAYETFTSGIHSMVSTSITDVDEAKLEAYSRLLVLTNIAA